MGDFFLIFKCCSLVSRLSWVYGLCLQPGIFFSQFCKVEKIGNFFCSFFLPKLANLGEIRLLWKHRFGPKFLLWCLLLVTKSSAVIFVANKKIKYPCRVLDFVTNNKHHNTKYSEFVAKSHTWAEEIDWDHTMQPMFEEEIDFMPLRCKHHPEHDILACFWLRVDGWSCSYIYQNLFSDFLRTAVMRSKNHRPDNPARGFMLSWMTPAQHLYSLFTWDDYYTYFGC